MTTTDIPTTAAWLDHCVDRARLASQAILTGAADMSYAQELALMFRAIDTYATGGQYIPRPWRPF